MADGLLTELERFAGAMIDAQQSLLEILQRRRTALAASDLETLAALQAPETTAAQRLESLITWRKKLLDSAQRAGMKFGTLLDLAQSISAPQEQAVVTQLQSARKLAAELQQEGWVQWVITNRCCHYYNEVIERITQGGQTAPTYQSNDWLQRGGAVLNASA